jgi:hypothetical protein
VDKLPKCNALNFLFSYLKLYPIDSIEKFALSWYESCSNFYFKTSLQLLELKSQTSVCLRWVLSHNSFYGNVPTLTNDIVDGENLPIRGPLSYL